MAKKLGDILMALLVLGFVIASFSLFINEADSRVSVSSGAVGSGFSAVHYSLDDGLKGYQRDLVEKVDNTSDVAPDPNVLQDNQGDGALGVLNLGSKNIVVSFFKVTGEKLPVANRIFAFLLALISITITILLLRAWRGEGKI